MAFSTAKRRFDRCGICGAAWLTSLVLSLGLVWTCVAQSNQLPSPWQHKTLANEFSKQRTIARVDHGYLVSFRRRLLEGRGNNVFVRSLTDGKEQQSSFWIEGASEVRIEDATVNASGQVYLAGSHTRQGEVSLTNFVATLDRSGKVTRVFDLGFYRPKRVCAMNDGSFWTFGQVPSAEREFYRGQLLREYSPDGKLLNAYLPVGKFPYLAQHDFKRDAVMLGCGDESVGIYLSRPSRWIEVQFSNRTANKWRIRPAPPGRVSGVALFGTHQVYASFVTRTVASDGKPTFLGTMYKLSLPADGLVTRSEDSPDISGTDSSTRLHSGSRAKGIWEPQLDVSQAAAGNRFLLGRDDQDLVYMGPTAQGADPTFYWVRP